MQATQTARKGWGTGLTVFWCIVGALLPILGLLIAGWGLLGSTTRKEGLIVGAISIGAWLIGMFALMGLAILLSY